MALADCRSVFLIRYGASRNHVQVRWVACALTKVIVVGNITLSVDGHDALIDVLITYRLHQQPATPRNAHIAHATLRHIVANMNCGKACLLEAAAQRALELTNGSTAAFGFEDKGPDDLVMIWAASAGINADLPTGEVPQHHSPCTLAQKESDHICSPVLHVITVGSKHLNLSRNF